MPHAGSCSTHNPIHCVVPPFILEKLAQSADRRVRERALINLQLGAQIRAARGIVSTLPALRRSRASCGSRSCSTSSGGSPR